MLDADFSDSLLIPLSPSYLLIRHSVETLCTCSIWCVLLESSFFSWESACDQHRAIHHCPDKGQGFCIFLKKTPPTSFNQCSDGH
ncbi:unnamed protein product [Staurois parvus]|uniref:Uncharacterized protein n=1 Tax=Staurois parvus TaxID=386267 RepID=A0ABN9BEZ4_9NEOB|nr:unnamed protein product [Staurois parvus]